MCARVSSVWRRRLLAREIPIVSEMDWFCCMVDDLLRHQVHTRTRMHLYMHPHTKRKHRIMYANPRTCTHTHKKKKNPHSNSQVAAKTLLAEAHEGIRCRPIRTAAQSASLPKTKYFHLQDFVSFSDSLQLF